VPRFAFLDPGPYNPSIIDSQSPVPRSSLPCYWRRLSANGITTVEEPAPTRDHTERMLQEFGAPVERNGNAVSVHGGVTLHSRKLVIPGDISSAAFSSALQLLCWIDLLIRDVGLDPTRTAFLSTLQAMGADIRIEDERLEGGEPVAQLE